jgi:hypothetical protein
MAAGGVFHRSSSGGAHSVHRVLHMDRSRDSQESEIAPDAYMATAHNTNSADPPTARRPPRDSRNATARWVVCAHDSWVSEPPMQSCR